MNQLLLNNRSSDNAQRVFGTCHVEYVGREGGGERGWGQRDIFECVIEYKQCTRVIPLLCVPCKCEGTPAAQGLEAAK